MNDTKTTIQELKDKMAQFVTEREWDQFHAPKNLSMAIAAEAAELMEKFLWVDSTASRKEVDANCQEIEDELADIIMASLAFANACDIDISGAFERKLALTKKKYPIEKVKGRSVKYTDL